MEVTSGWPVIPSTFKAGPALELGEVMQGLIGFQYIQGMANSQPLSGPLLQCLTALTVKDVFLKPNCNCNVYLLAALSLCTPDTSWLQCLYCSFSPSRRLNRSVPSLLFSRQAAFPGHAPLCPHLCCTGRPQPDTVFQRCSC